MEDTNKSKRCGKLPGVCKFLSMLYTKLQPYCQAIKQTKGKKEWKWEEEHQKAFEELKKKIISQLILALLRREGKFRVETDASEHAIRGVLSQEQEGK